MKRIIITGLVLGLLGTLTPIMAQKTDDDPKAGEVILGEEEGWQASLVYDAGCGVWAVGSYDFFPELGCPELLACDDRGRATILISYSGKWTPKATVTDGQWLAPSLQGHHGLGPRTLVVGGAGGRLYEVRPRAEGHSDSLLRAEFPGEEIHSLVNLPMSKRLGHDIALVFLKSGRFFSYAFADGRVLLRELPRLEGRVRDVLVESADAENGEAVIWTVSRRGQAVRRRLGIAEDGSLERHDDVILDEPMGLGRITVGSGAFAGNYYISRDDGVYLRVRRDETGQFQREVFYEGDQGPRGIVAGRFDPDREVETVAVFGYSGRVELLSRRGEEPVQARTLFVDKDKGHWLAKAELDGRNATEELVSSGFSGRVVLLSRVRETRRKPVAKPRFGSSGSTAAADQESPSRDRTAKTDGPQVAPIRIATALIPRPEAIDSLNYGGGFYTKTATYATLLDRAADGSLEPGLAERWWFEDEGKTWFFELARNRRLQDGSRLDAAAVKNHFAQIKGDARHNWLGLARNLKEIEVRSEFLIVFHLERPWAIDEEVVAVNPCGIRAPGSFDERGGLRAPLGSGPLRPDLETATEDRLTYLDEKGAAVIQLVRTENAEQSLFEGKVDLVIDDWNKRLDVTRIPGTTRSYSVAGSSVYYLGFNLQRERWSRTEARRELRRHFRGFRDVPDMERATGWAASIIEKWPRSEVLMPADSPPEFENNPGRCVVLIDRGMPGADALTEMFKSIYSNDGHGSSWLDVRAYDRETFELKKLRGDYDLILERSWGLPYDPFLSLAARFDPPIEETAATKNEAGLHAGMRQLVERVMTTPDAAKRWSIAGEIQTMLDEEALILPIAVPRRRAVYSGPLRLPNDLFGPNLYDLPVEAFRRAMGLRD